MNKTIHFRSNFIIVFLGLITLSGTASAQSINFCDLYGAVYVEKDPYNAHFIVYLEETEGSADVLVYKEDNKLFADRKGIWHMTDNKGLADFIVFFEKNRRNADFSIYYTDVESFAGCQ